jgi:hypothetical protein
VTKLTSSRSDDWIYCHFGYTLSLNYNYYSAIADLHNLQFTVALGISVFIRRLLATDLNTETSTSNHYEVFLPFLVQSSWNLGSKLKLLSAASGLALYTVAAARTMQKTVLLLRCADHTENTSDVTATQLVHWRADCCLATSYHIRSLRHSFHCYALKCVYQAVA